MKDAEEVERLGARLRYLCRRITRDRRPFCPINGILLLIPYASTGGDAEAKEAGSLCQRDLEAVRESFQVECPIFALVCDLERVPGFDEFLKFFPEGQRRRLLGQQLPLAPDLDAAGRAKMTEKGVQWVGDVLFPRLVYKVWGVEGADPAAGNLSASANVGLYEFLARIRGSHRAARPDLEPRRRDAGRPAPRCSAAAPSPRRARTSSASRGSPPASSGS